MKIVEIVSAKEVKVHRTFRHPIYQGNTKDPQLWFSNDLELMLEVLNPKRITLYQWNNEEWQEIKKLTIFDIELNGSTVYPVAFSPDFKHYIDYDYTQQSFVLRDSFTENVVSVIPAHIMNKKNDSASTKFHMNRFRWIANDSFQYVSKDGFERVIKWEVTEEEEGDQWIEVGSGQLPFFSVTEAKSNHFYVDPVFYPPKDVLLRLKQS